MAFRCSPAEFQLEELYAEVIYEILHNVGCDVESGDEQQRMIQFLQRAFHIDGEKHEELLSNAKSKEAPNILLHVEVIEAKDLSPKDANGLSDPFCTLYLATAPTHRYNTSVKSETLAPLWEEHFSLPLDGSADETLCLEVWDFDPAETVREKMTKIMDVKGVRGFRKLVKEIAVTASTGKHDNEFVGSAQIPLKSIPASGQTMWLQLEKKSKTKKQGDVKIKLSFSSEKNCQVSFQEYRHLVRLLLLYELDQSKIEAYQWSGNWSELATDILTQHVVQCALSADSESVARWVEFTTVHCEYPLSFTVFHNLAEKLVNAVRDKLLSAEEEKLFWEGVKKLLPLCIKSIRTIRKLTPTDKSNQLQISAILSICGLLQSIKPPSDLDLFPESLYGWLERTEDKEYDILMVIRSAITQGATEWSNSQIDSNNQSGDGNMEAKLRHLIAVVSHLQQDVQKAIEFYDAIFQRSLGISYAKSLFDVYEAKVCSLVEEEIRQACQCLKPLKLESGVQSSEYDGSLSLGTTLFELYLNLQRLVTVGKSIYGGSADELEISKFHTWFQQGVAQWLDIALFKALQRIDKAAVLDNLQPVDSSVRYSSSAVDTLAIFYQIKTFWKQLAWPDVEGSYTFVAKILDDVCRCCTYYADQMIERVAGLGEVMHPVYGPKFSITTEWCLAINNIDYVRNSIPRFVAELDVTDIIRRLADIQTPATADHCSAALHSMVDNVVDSVGNKILDLMETVSDKMGPSINRFLLEGAELLNQDNNYMDRLMQYLDENLMTLHEHLNEDNFDSMVNVLWSKVATILCGLVETHLEKRRPPSFFSNLYITLQALIKFFKKGEHEVDDEMLKRVTSLLRLHGLETAELIHQFHLDRAESQDKNEADQDLGILTIKAHFIDLVLRVEIMNGRNLKAKNGSGSCDPFVKLILLPEEKFAAVPKHRTKTQKKTPFPLFDEVFTIPMTHEQRRNIHGLLHLVVKDSDFIGTAFMGEAYLPFSDIPDSNDPGTVPQIHLKLHRPVCFDSDALRALEYRQGDKQARDFLKKVKSKLMQ